MHTMTPTVEQVPARGWQDWTAEHDAVVLDVREPAEWAMGVLPGARTMAMSRISTEWQQLDPETPVLVVCRSGNRSNTVARALAQAGFERVANMSGGMVALGLA
jgi:rhodanese-related sulfurtransferase